MYKNLDIERACADVLAEIRWPGGLVCRCGGTTFGRIAARPRVWQCRRPTCRKQHSVTAGTALHGCHMSLHDWLLAATRVPAGESASRLQHELGVSYPTAFRALLTGRRARWVDLVTPRRSLRRPSTPSPSS